MVERDTIFAPVTAPGRAAVAIVRVSGPRSDEVLRALIGDLPEPRRAALRQVRDPASGEVLDEALVLRFSEGRSFTGETSFELQGHGGRAAVEAVLRVLSARPGLRLAEPGEFTRRAVEAGRLDLSQAEGLADLALAETEAQRRQAVRAMSGELGRSAAAWRRDLIRARALLEASMEFTDEDDVPEEVGPEARSLTSGALESVKRVLAGAGAAERVREGFEVALVGPPNSGKSSLINALVKRDVAIASCEAGTTRDVIEVRMDLAGQAVTVLDTAGLRLADGAVEKAGVSKAVERAAGADLRVWLGGPGERRGWQGLEVGREDIVVSSRSDLYPGGDGLRVSVVTGEGLEGLISLIDERVSGWSGGASMVLRGRHREGMETAADELSSVMGFMDAGASELAAEHLRRATDALGRMCGTVDAEDVLDDIFSTFCLGK
ncbi:MAG: tRNA uridine-5-carboxymethylaminomethyl(34) synthesis GTPase MnmE [Pseudomonadota bacterium]